MLPGENINYHPSTIFIEASSSAILFLTFFDSSILEINFNPSDFGQMRDLSFDNQFISIIIISETFQTYIWKNLSTF